jgi:hypothetical protein
METTEWTNKEIKSIIMCIRNSNIPNKATYYEHIYPEFKKKFPILFDKVTSDHFPLEFLDMMLKQRGNLFEEKQTVEETDKVVYDQLRERYINPVLDKIVLT